MLASSSSQIGAGLVTIGLAYLALRRLWSSQHRLDRRASVLRWSAVGVGIVLMYGSFHWYDSNFLFIFGEVVCFLFFMFPDIPFYLMRTSTSRSGSTRT